MAGVDTIVVGAGVVGLAIARAEALAGRDVLILEAAERFGTGTSARNSEVLHAGIFHAPGMLKSRLCVAGRRAVLRYCAERGFRIGGAASLVATDAEELALLATYRVRAEPTGSSATRRWWRSRRRTRALEPARIVWRRCRRRRPRSSTRMR
jgi:L-2-hydroxyglutarate oxidase LhgO